MREGDSGLIGDSLSRNSHAGRPRCFCPEELGGSCHFEPVTDDLTDWMPTHEHFPRSKREGAVDNAVLPHRLCNRIDYSIDAESLRQGCHPSRCQCSKSTLTYIIRYG
jgi:hypothetical protein